MLDKRAGSAIPSNPVQPGTTGERPQVGLVLGSGGARGVVHISVIETLSALGIPIDMIAGSSIGSVIGGIYAAGALKEFKKDLVEMKQEDLLRLFDPVLSLSGLFAAKKAIAFLERYVPRQTRIEDCPVPLAIVTTDYDTGHPVVFRKGNLLDAVRASLSIPGIFTPARFGDSFLVDGAVSDPLPIDVAKEMGADLTIAISLQPTIGKIGLIPSLGHKVRARNKKAPKIKIPGMGKLSDHLSEGDGKQEDSWLKEAEHWLGGHKAKAGDPRKPPNVFEVLTRSIDIMGYTNTLLMLSSHPPTVLIEFDFPDIPTLDFSGCAALIEEGKRAVLSKKHEILDKFKPSPTD